MRPDSIRQFDYFYGASAALGMLSVLAALDKLDLTGGYLLGTRLQFLATYVLTGGFGASIWLGLLGVIVVPGLIWYFAAIRANNTARWIALVRAALGALRLAFLLYLLGWLIVTHVPVPSWVWYCMMFGVIGETLQLAAVYFLFPEDSREWYLVGGRAAPRPEEVFG